MVKVVGPIFSSTAKGNMERILVYTRTKGINIVKRFIKSLDRKTERKLLIREVYKNGCSAWNSLTPTEKEEYEEKSKTKNITGFNLFMREYLKENIPPFDYGIYEISKYGSCCYAD